MKDETRAALTDQGTWMRLPAMLLFFLLLQVATPLLIAVSLVAWLMRLFTGRQPQGVVEFGKTIGEWFDRTADYLCGGAHRRPFPFEDHDCPSDRAADGDRKSATSAPAAEHRTGASPAAQKSAHPDGEESGQAVPSVEKSSSEPTRRKSSAKKSKSSPSTAKKSSKKKSAGKKSARKTAKKAAKKSASKKAGGPPASENDKSKASGD